MTNRHPKQANDCLRPHPEANRVQLEKKHADWTQLRGSHNDHIQVADSQADRPRSELMLATSKLGAEHRSTGPPRLEVDSDDSATGEFNEEVDEEVALRARMMGSCGGVRSEQKKATGRKKFLDSEDDLSNGTSLLLKHIRKRF
ncbi:hypothetical protein B0A50_04120 [Salinomyces thailandicus]|uniref:Uncharacterized protein n=1 Tax=Salinomyces thailandicus TaxID=706561 RepID=A0A4V5N4Q6_9PEZI|nr:hypothetical protein B0A50_04120 [Salinomyces thailandica]